MCFGWCWQRGSVLSLSAIGMATQHCITRLPEVSSRLFRFGIIFKWRYSFFKTLSQENCTKSLVTEAMVISLSKVSWRYLWTTPKSLIYFSDACSSSGGSNQHQELLRRNCFAFGRWRRIHRHRRGSNDHLHTTTTI